MSSRSLWTGKIGAYTYAANCPSICGVVRVRPWCFNGSSIGTGMTTLTEGVGRRLHSQTALPEKLDALTSSSSSAARVFHPCPNFLNLSRRPNYVSCGGGGQVAKRCEQIINIYQHRSWHNISLDATMVLVSRRHTLKHRPKPQPERVMISGG